MLVSSSFLKMSCNPKLKLYRIDRFIYVHCWKVTSIFWQWLWNKRKRLLEVSNGDIGSAFNYLCSLFCLASYKHMDLGNFYVTNNSNMNMWCLVIFLLEMSLLKHCWNVVVQEPWFMTFFLFSNLENLVEHATTMEWWSVMELVLL
jgi:hypothetical protein